MTDVTGEILLRKMCAGNSHVRFCVAKAMVGLAFVFCGFTAVAEHSFKVLTCASSVDVKTVDEATYCRFDILPAELRLGSLLGVKLVEDGIEIDLREVFASGARMVVLHGPACDASAFADADVDFVADISGFSKSKFAMVEVAAEGRSGEQDFVLKAPRNKVIRLRKTGVFPGRHDYLLTAIVPEGATELRTRLEFTAPGDAPIRFHGTTACRVAARPTPPEIADPKVLVHLPFDGSFAGKSSGGTACQLGVKGVTFVEGRHGQAACFDGNDGTRLLYDLSGLAKLERGTLTCWIRFEDCGSARFCALNANVDKCPGDGSIQIMYTPDTNGKLRCERGDYSKNETSWPIRNGLADAASWKQLTVAWDELGMSAYMNGVKLPRGKISDNTCPLNDILFEPPVLRFAGELSREIKFLAFGASNEREKGWKGALDDVRIWSEPFTVEHARAFYEKDSGEKAVMDRPNELPLWDAPWRDPKFPPPPNRALAPATDTPGVPANMELVDEVFPAELARNNATNRFRVAGKWSVGRCEGLEYLEAGCGRHDRFAVRFNLDGSIPLYCFEIMYPDDRTRTIDLIAQNSRNPKGHSLNSGIETGLEHPLTSKNATKTFLYWVDDLFAGDIEKNGDLTLVVMTQDKGCPAAISRIRVYAVRDGRLPDMKMSAPPSVNGMKRRSAIWLEDPAIMGNFGTMLPSGSNADPLLMIDRLAAYMRYTGQDTLIYPAVWYSGIIGDNYQPRNHMSHFMREVCRRFERDGLAFVPSVNQQLFPQIKLDLTRRSLSDGSLHATPISILNTGRPNLGGWHHSPTYYNISHPDVQNALFEEIDLVCDECKSHPSFLGMAFDPMNAINVTTWGMITAGYNDYSVEAFEKATGVKVPVDRADPMRGRAYAKWLLQNEYARWVQWRCDVLTDFYRRVVARVRSHRPDLMVFLRCPIIWRTKLERRPDLFRDDFPNRILRESGLDCAALSRIEGLALANCSMPAWWHDELHSLKAPRENLERLRDLPETKEYLDLFTSSEYPFSDFHESYYESPVGRKKSGSGYKYDGDGRLRGDWLNEHPWRVTHFAASGREALRPYAKSLKFGDYFAFGRGGYLLGTCGDEAVTAPWMRTFRALPAVKFRDVADFTHPSVRFRSAKALGKLWFYVVNTGFDSVDVKLPMPSGIVDAVTGEKIGQTIRLDSYEIRAFHSTNDFLSPRNEKE